MGRKKKEAINYERILPFLLPVLMILIWSLWTILINPETILPSPVQLIRKFISDFTTRALFTVVWVNIKRVFLALFIGSITGFIMGLVNGLIRLADLCLHSTIHMFRNVPMIVFFIVLLFFLGLGENTIIILAAIEVFIPVYISIYKGIKSIDKKFIDMGKVTGFDKFTIFKEIIFPTGIFSMINGIKQSLRSVWTLLIGIDLILTYQRVGSKSAELWESVQLEQLIISMLLYIVLCKLVYGIIEVFEKRTFNWK